MTALDKLGQPIEPGVFIVYGSLLGRSAALRIGKVIAVREMPWKYNRPCFHIDVVGVREAWNNNLYLLKQGTLQYAERTIVLAKQYVPQAYRDLLETV